jgi:hypothetical protein
MGKYTKLKKDMVRFTQPTDWQLEIDNRKVELRQTPNAELADLYNVTRDKKDDLHEQERKLNTTLEAISQLLVDRLETDGLTSFKTEDGTTMYIKDEPYCSAQDKASLLQWVKEQGMEELLSIHYQTLSGLVKTRLENGEELPPGVAVFMKSSIQRRAGRS